MQTIPTGVPTFVELQLQVSQPTGVPTYKPSVCVKTVLEQTVLLHPLKHYLDNIALQEVVYCYHNGEKKTINKGRQTDHYNP